MATYTQNYNLKMPSGQDAPDVEDFNTNAEIIDTVLKAHSDNTADEYSPDETYTAGRLVINNNALWKAKQDIDVAEAWTPEHWELTTLAAELSAVNSRIDSIPSIIQAQIFDGTVACEANVQKNITNYTVPDGYTLMGFDVQVSGTSLVSKMISLYHTSTNIYMCADVAQNYSINIRATYLKS